MSKRRTIVPPTLLCLMVACGGKDPSPGTTSAGASNPAVDDGGQRERESPDSPTDMSPGTNASSGERDLPRDLESTNGSQDSSEASEGPGVPCDVASIIGDHCSTCHGETPQFGAPMSLVRAEDFQRQSPLSQQPVHQAVAQRTSLDAARPMPPPGTVAPLSDEERLVLSEWLSSGASPVQDGCAITPTPSDTPALGDYPSSGSSQLPYEGWDAGDIECYPLVANAGDLTSPYPVGVAVDEYVGFEFAPPWGEGTRYVRAFRSVVDNAQALHHWLLFQQAGSVQDGSVTPQIGAHPDGLLLHGWAPGGGDAYYTPEVAVELEAGKGYLLEIHYNSSDAAAVDASGVEVCVTATPPENVALLSWLGTDAINGTRASGTCRPRSDEPIHIISGSPHMHLKGRHMTVTVHRADGTDEVVHDEPFDFNNQRIYDEDITIFPGDTIETTCEFSSPARFGRGTNEEMCYWFAQSYPAGALADGAFLGTLIHGANSCLGQ